MIVTKDNNGKPIGFIETLISNERVVTINATRQVATVTTRDRNNGKVKNGNVFRDLAAPEVGLDELLLAISRSAPRPSVFADKPAHPYCPEHQREMDAMQQTDKDWDEILASHEAVCEEPREEQRLCAACNRRPVHTDCRSIPIVSIVRNAARMMP